MRSATAFPASASGTRSPSATRTARSTTATSSGAVCSTLLVRAAFAAQDRAPLVAVPVEDLAGLVGVVRGARLRMLRGEARTELVGQRPQLGAALGPVGARRGTVPCGRSPVRSRVVRRAGRRTDGRC